MVYVALGIFLFGMGYRVYRWLGSPKTPVKTGFFPKGGTVGSRGFGLINDVFVFPETLQVDRRMWVFTILFHVGLIGALFGHLRLIREFTPLVHFFGVEGMEELSLLGGGIMGVILIVTLAYFLLRRFTSPFKEMSVLEDYLLLGLLLLIVVMGNHLRFAGDVKVSEYRAYVQSLLTLKPAFTAPLAESSIKSALAVHVLFVNLLLIYFPFSKLVHVIATFPANLARRR
jgi:nitrate reductase gamma subunit